MARIQVTVSVRLYNNNIPPQEGDGNWEIHDQETRIDVQPGTHTVVTADALLTALVPRVLDGVDSRFGFKPKTPQP